MLTGTAYNCLKAWLELEDILQDHCIIAMHMHCCCLGTLIIHQLSRLITYLSDLMTLTWQLPSPSQEFQNEKASMCFRNLPLKICTMLSTPHSINEDQSLSTVKIKVIETEFHVLKEVPNNLWIYIKTIVWANIIKFNLLCFVNLFNTWALKGNWLLENHYLYFLSLSSSHLVCQNILYNRKIPCNKAL